MPLDGSRTNRSNVGRDGSRTNRSIVGRDGSRTNRSIVGRDVCWVVHLRPVRCVPRLLLMAGRTTGRDGSRTHRSIVGMDLELIDLLLVGMFAGKCIFVQFVVCPSSS